MESEVPNSDADGEEVEYERRLADSTSSSAPALQLDPSAQTPGRYVPPALRAKQAQGQAGMKSEAQLKLSRQVKGLLNKCVPVFYVTATLTDLIITSISSRSSLLDTFVVLQAALVSSLHKVLGVNFAAFFVQALVEEYEKQYNLALASTIENGDEAGDGEELVKGKEASNLLVLLAELYTFQVVSCVLMYDIIREFLSGDLSEFEVELFLKLLKNLRSADTKGKWWLVGSAWAGNPLVDRKQQNGNEIEDQDRSVLDQEAEAHAEQSAALLKLAKKQGMNTDVRRSIFVVLMSSEDYVDACERLGHLKISDQQRPEVEKAYNPYYTLIAQHLSTSTRNVRFSLQYCLWDLFREFGESIRRSNDDGDDLHAEEENSVSKTKLRNLARAYAWWVAKGAVALDMLKPLSFLNLKSQTTLFLRTFFAQLFVSAQSASPLLDFATEDEREVASLSRDREVLEVIIMKSIKSSNVVQGMMYFFEQEADDFVGMARDDEVKKLIRWGVKVAKDTLGTGGEVANLL
ncbi:suppressor of glycerol defect [Tulasnella sp. 427]|nr:suppressor of glycerol defect [Tulasnella sp. 427]